MKQIFVIPVRSAKASARRAKVGIQTHPNLGENMDSRFRLIRSCRQAIGGNDRRRVSNWFLIFLTSLPLIALAQAPNPAPVNTVLTNFLALLTMVIKILISSALLVFGWGIVKLIFTTKAGDAKKIGETKQILLWSIIGIFVLASLGGIIIFLKTYLGIPNNVPIQPPTFTTFVSSPSNRGG